MVCGQNGWEHNPIHHKMICLDFILFVLGGDLSKLKEASVKTERGYILLRLQKTQLFQSHANFKFSHFHVYKFKAAHTRTAIKTSPEIRALLRDY